ncbi:S8 family serine peptidase [Luteimonas sp. Y-2-2-4F]|nr:S8 family peptidase [Luteimonas sp. Y-2-2-4F]MCD9032773.1 S8 family serine peptidase [Luteimonas sp. Y-2-2-4F]
MTRSLRTLAGLATCAAVLAAATAADRPLAAPAERRTVPSMPQAAPAPERHQRFIVRYHDGPGAPADAQAALRRIQSTAGTSLARATGAAAPLRHLRRTAAGAHVVASPRALDAAEAAAFLAALRTDPQLAYAQPDHRMRPAQLPDDPLYAELQWDMHHPVGGVDAPGAWALSDGEGVVVAVLDTGYAEHADLLPNLVPGYDFISAYGQVDGGIAYPDVAGDGDGRDPDARDPGDWVDESMLSWCPQTQPSSWHGTHVAGTVAAVARNGLGIAGLAHGARVQPVRVLGHCGGDTSDIVDALVWASGGQVPGVPDNPTPAEVVNLSLGSAQPCAANPAMQEAIDGALARGTTVVAAAGNFAQNAAGYTPAGCRGVIAVAAHGDQGNLAFYSNFGSAVALSAPGGDTSSDVLGWIWSTANAGATGPVPGPAGDVIAGMVGTSMAAPHVAATVALMQSAAVAHGHPPLTPAQARAVLRGTARPFGLPPPADRPAGAGLLDAAATTAIAAEGIDETALAVPLADRVPAGPLSGDAGEDQLFRIEVPAGTASLSVRSYGGSGDARLYAAFGRIPTAADHDRVSQQPGNAESIAIARPAAGTHYLRLAGDAPYAQVSVLALLR